MLVSIPPVVHNNWATKLTSTFVLSRLGILFVAAAECIVENAVDVSKKVPVGMAMLM